MTEMKRMIALLGLCALGLCACSTEPTRANSSTEIRTELANPTKGYPQDGKYEGVMLQGFYWDSFGDSRWSNLERMAKELSPYFSLIWVPQSAEGAAQLSMGYDPKYWFKQNSSFGSEAQLRSMIRTYRQYNVGIVADVVINHRANASTWNDFTTESYNGKTYTLTYNDIVSNDEAASQAPGAEQRRTGANPDTGDNFDGIRDLDHRSPNVQNLTKAYVDFLKNDLGYAGFRYDMVKGFAAEYVRMYNESCKIPFSVGEYWDSYDPINKWIQDAQHSSTAFDFPNKYQLNQACNDGKWSSLVWKNLVTNKLEPAGLIHMNSLRRYAVTFVDNHDTARHSDAVRNKVMAANAYILSMPGTPCVFLKHWQAHKDEIKKLILTRRATGVHNESEVEVLETNEGIFVAKCKGLYGELIVKVGPKDFNPPMGYTLTTYGDNYAVWLDSRAKARYKEI